MVPYGSSGATRTYVIATRSGLPCAADGVVSGSAVVATAMPVGSMTPPAVLTRVLYRSQAPDRLSCQATKKLTPSKATLGKSCPPEVVEIGIPVASSTVPDVVTRAP